MEILSVIFTAVLSVAVMFILAKVIGNRAISQMNVFDYINSITIGSIASELAISDIENMLRPLIAMLVYAIAVVLFAYVSCKSLWFRRVVEGRTIILMRSGKILDRNFKRAKIDVNEFMMQCRLNGYFNLSDIKTAVQESNGKISILPYSSAKTVTISDLKLEVAEETIYFNIILDGKVLWDNLKNAGFNEEWLNKKLKENKLKNKAEIFVAICNQNGEFYVYKKQSEEDKKDMFDI